MPLVPDITLPQALMYIGAGVALIIIYLANRNRSFGEDRKKKTDTFAYVQAELKPEDKEILRGLSKNIEHLARSIESTGSKLTDELRWFNRGKD